MNLNTIGAFDGADLLGLNNAEYLLVWSWRRIVTGHLQCPLIDLKFEDACREDAAEVFATFCTFLRSLAYATRRRIVIGHPGSGILTADEKRVLLLLAAAQADLPTLFDAHLCWLARIEACHVLAIGAGALITAFRANHLYLPLPKSPRPPIDGDAAILNDGSPRIVEVTRWGRSYC